jgi:hypothetical protein
VGKGVSGIQSKMGWKIFISLGCELPFPCKASDPCQKTSAKIACDVMLLFSAAGSWSISLFYLLPFRARQIPHLLFAH